MKKTLIYYMNDINDSFIESAKFSEKKRSVGFVKYALAAACICLVAVGSVYMLSDKTPQIKPSADSVTDQTVITTPQVTTQNTDSEQFTPPVVDNDKTEIILFESTVEKGPETDAYHEDELHHVEIYLNGENLYVQATEENFSELSISGELSSSDFGESLGVVSELMVYDTPLLTPCSQEPTLAGCEVYRYAPAGCEAVIIVKGNDKCSLFVSANQLSGDNYEKLYKMFGIECADDIVRIDYEILKPSAQGSMIETTNQGTIDNKMDIDYFYDVTRNLRAIVRESNLSGDPQWLTDARAEYFSLPDRYEVGGKVVSRCGLTLEFSYYPQLGDGYFTESHFVTKEQNSVLEKMFEE